MNAELEYAHYEDETRYRMPGPFVVDGITYQQPDECGDPGVSAIRCILDVYDDSGPTSALAYHYHSQPPSDTELDAWVSDRDALHWL